MDIKKLIEFIENNKTDLIGDDWLYMGEIVYVDELMDFIKEQIELVKMEGE